MNEELYQKLHSAGYYTKSFDDFQSKYGNDVGQQELYSKLNSSGFYTKDFNSFRDKYFQEQKGGLASFGKTLQSTVTDLIPQSAVGYIQREVSQVNKDREDPYSIISMAEKLSSALGVPVDKQEATKRGQELQLSAEKYISQQKQEAAQKLQGVTQSYKDIHNLSSLSSYIGQALGQGIGQIPLSAITQGASSYLMEASEIYDSQLDLLANKHGISREEVIKQGLDKPAEGEAYAILAAALDTFSAGQVLGLFKKQAAKELTKEATESVLKKIGKNFVQGAAPEFATEASQGVLERLGAAKGAGVDANINPTDIINEGLSGAIGGGGIHVATTNPFSKNTHPAAETIVDFEKSIADLSTGNPELDLSIDELVEGSTEYINKLFDKTHEIAGTRSKEELAKLREENNALKLQKQTSEQAQLGKILRGELETLSAMPHPGFQTTDTTVPKYDPQTLDEVGQQAAKQFDFQLPHGSAQGTIVGASASLDAIYAAKDVEGNVIKGKNLYGNLLNQLRIQGVNALTVGNQTAASAAALSKLVDKGELNIDPRGDVTFGSKTIHTRFNITPSTQITNQPIVQNDNQNEQGVPSQVGEGQESVQPQPIQSTSSETSTPSGILQAPQETRKNTKEQLIDKQEEQRLDIEVKLKKQIANIVKRPPTARVAALEKVISKAQELGMEHIVSEAEKHSQKAFSEIEATEERKIELKELKTKRAETKTRKAEEAIKQEEEKKLREEKKASWKINEKIPGTEVTLKQAKEAYLRDIAYLRESGDKDYKKRAEQYVRFRKKYGLKESTLEDVLEQTKAESYIEHATRRISKETSRSHAIAKRVSSMKKEGKPTEDIQKVQTDLENALKEEVSKALGVDLNSLSGMNLHQVLSTPYLTHGLKNMTIENTIKKNKLKVSSTSELIKKLSNLSDPRTQDIIKLLKAVENSLTRQGKKLTVLHYNMAAGGFYAQGKKEDVLLIAELTDKLGNFIEAENASHTIHHEITHILSDILSRVALQGDNNYSRDLGKLYDQSKIYLHSKIVSILTKLNNDNHLTEHEGQILNSVYENIEKFYGKESINFIEDAIAEHSAPETSAKFIMSRLYGMLNKNEMASEALSSYKFAGLLHLIPYKGDVNKQGKETILTSLFSKIREALQKFVKKYFEGPSAFQAYESITQEYVNQIEEAQEFRSFNPYFYAPTLKDIEQRFPSFTPKKVIEYRENLIKNLIKDQGALSFKKIVNPNANEEIINNIARTLEGREEIKTIADVKDYIERVNKRLLENRKLGEIYSHIIYDKIQVIRRRRRMTTAFVKSTLDKAKLNPKYKASFKYKTDVDDFTFVNINKMPFSLLPDLRQGVDALMRDSLISEKAYDIMINYGKKLEKLNAMTKIASKIDQKLSNFTSGAVNASSFSSILGRYDKHTSSTILKNIYGGMMEVFSKVGIEAHRFTTALSKMADKNNLTHSNLSKIAMYGSIFSTKTDPRNKAEWEAEVKENAKFVLESALAKQSASDSKNYQGDLSKKEIAKEIEIATDLHKKIELSPKMEGILSTGETEFYEYFKKFAKEHEQDFFRNSFGAWGADIEPRHNYFPTTAQGKVNGLLSGENDDLIRNNKDNLFEALGLRDSKNDKSAVYSKKSNSQYKRLNPKGYFYNYDAMNIAEKWSKNMLYDLYATTELKALNRLFRDPKFRSVINNDTTNAFIKQVRAIAGVGNKFDSEALPFFLDVPNKIREKLYTAALATGGQIFNQSSSGFAAAAVISAMAGKQGLPILLKSVRAVFRIMFNTSEGKKLKQFLEDNALGIQLRDVLFEKYLGSDEFKTYTKKKIGKTVDFLQNATELSLRAGDKLGARVVWFAAYFKAGGTLENPTKDAVLEAERQVGIMQNMSDINFSSPWFKYDSAAKKVLMGMFYAYKSFAVNAYTNILYSTKNLKNPDARVVLTAQLGSVLAYHAMAACVTKPLYDAVVNGLMGDDDDEQEEQKRVGRMQQIVAETLWDTGALSPLFGMAAPSGLDAMARYLWAQSETAKKMYAPEDGIEPYNKYLDNPIYSMPRAQDFWKQTFGPGYKELGEGAILGAQYHAMLAESDEFFDQLEKAEKQKQKLDELQMFIMVNLWATSPLPFGGDIKKIMQMQMRKEKARNLKNSKGTGAGSEGTELPEGTSEYQEKDYELIPE